MYLWICTYIPMFDPWIKYDKMISMIQWWLLKLWAPQDCGFELPSAWNMSLPCFMATAKTLRQFPALGLSIGHREPVMRKPLLQLHMLYIYIYTQYPYVSMWYIDGVCVYINISLRGGRSPKVSWGFMGCLVTLWFVQDLFQICLGFA